MLTILGWAAASASDQIPGAPQKKPIALVNGTLHPVSGPAIESGTLIFDNGKIVNIGRRIKPPKGVDVITSKESICIPA